MTNIDLEKYGIKEVDTVYHNLSYEELFLHETSTELESFEKGYVTNIGAVTVDTGIFTGRSPNDKYIVVDEESEKNVWWAGPGRKGSDNKPINKETWNHLVAISSDHLSRKKLYVTDAYCGVGLNTRINIRVISEVAWVSHFVKNMFVRPSEEELKSFEPHFVMLHACKTINKRWKEFNMNSEVYIAFNLTEKMAVIGGTWYGGEIKKGFFSIMNYYQPLRGTASMHCSANMGKDGDTAVFFGLSGTGKTTLSTDPERMLIGDDEHGWDDEGIFNYEGGCYAKCINLDKDKEPDIYKAIRRDALLENVVFDTVSGEIDFKSDAKTENTRVAYPIYHIENIVKPESIGGHPKKVIFLCADAFGLFPPVSKLSLDQAMYYYLSGYTAKLAGTERGIIEPSPTFSSCFGAPFLLLHPTKYAEILSKRMKENGSQAYLINTGWTGGPYGTGKRIDIHNTRAMVRAILNGSIEKGEFYELPLSKLLIPEHIDGIDDNILNPRKTWKDGDAFDEKAKMLLGKFIDNFKTYTDTPEGKRLESIGPQL